jgi:N-acetyl-anhydromuramyl-L-alanine amidase AmpD
MAASGYYLLDHPPARRQFRTSRRAEPTGCNVIHTAENATDITGADGGAEAVARFIAGRTDAAGSYHRVGDRDSHVPLVPFSSEAFHDGTGSNSWSVGLALAMRAADWPRLSADDRDAYLATLVRMAVESYEWHRTHYGIIIPAVHLTVAESDAGKPGFIGHGERDPGRRSDPGRGFPWGLFLTRYARATNQKGPTVADPNVKDEIKWWQAWLNGFDVDRPKLEVDGVRGPLTNAYAAAVHLEFEANDGDNKHLIPRAEFGDRAIALIRDAGRFV